MSHVVICGGPLSPRGGTSTRYEGLARPAGRRRHAAQANFEHAGRSCAIFVANTVARVSGEPGEGLAAARGLRGFAVNRNHGRLPALNLSRRFRSPGHLSHRSLTVLQDARDDVSKKFRFAPVAVAFHEQQQIKRGLRRSRLLPWHALSR